METFKLKGKKYHIKWSYDIVDQSDSKPVTFCDIIDSESGDTISYAFAKVSPNDNFVRKIGRKLSFQRALLGCFNKEERQEIWKICVPAFTTKLIELHHAKNEKK